MPSKLPTIMLRLDLNLKKKIEKIAEINERSTSKEIVYLIKREVEKYETENGEIKID